MLVREGIVHSLSAGAGAVRVESPGDTIYVYLLNAYYLVLLFVVSNEFRSK